MDVVETKLQELKDLLAKWEDQYYKGTPLVEDEIYDSKLRELIDLENQYPKYITLNSPTQRVGKTKNNPIIKVKHEVPMLSLNNVYNIEEACKFWKTIEKSKSKSADLLKDISDEDIQTEYFIEPKIDGVSISLIYKNNQLHQAISRGDGTIGEDLTDKVKIINKVPLLIRDGPGNFIIRGEIFITKSDFAEIQEQFTSEEESFSNHRNYVAGTLRLKNTEELKHKKLSIVCYFFSLLEGGNAHSIPSKQSEIIDLFRSWSITTHPIDKTIVSSSQDEMVSFIEEFENIKEEWNWPVDGLVLKVNDLSVHDQIGYTSKFPKWATAYKYPSLVKETKLLKIETTVGRTGKINYLANLEPVDLNGTIVQHATLHNIDNIEKLDLRVGDIVKVYKSGEIIPQVLGYVETTNRHNLKKFEMPTTCPSCGTDLFIKSKKNQLCVYKDCFDQKLAKLTYFVSRPCMNIEWLSEQILLKLINLKILTDIPSIYTLHEHKDTILNSKINIKERLFQKLIDSIEASKQSNQAKVLVSLGIDLIGSKTAKILLQTFGTIPALFNASLEEIQVVYGVGVVCAQEILDWYQIEENKELIKHLENIQIIKDEVLESNQINTILMSKSVVITGSFSISRDQLSTLLETKYGTIIKKSMSKKIDFLILGDNPGSKLEDAQNLGIKILTITELEKMGIFAQ